VCCAAYESAQFVKKAAVRIKFRVWVRIRFKVWVSVSARVSVRFRSEICKLCMRDFEIVQHILQQVT